MVRMWLSNREEISYPSDNRIGRKCEAYLTKASFADGSEDLKMIEVDCGRYLKIIAWHTLWANPNSYYLLMVNWVMQSFSLIQDGVGVRCSSSYHYYYCIPFVLSVKRLLFPFQLNSHESLEAWRRRICIIRFVNIPKLLLLVAPLCWIFFILLRVALYSLSVPFTVSIASINGSDCHGMISKMVPKLVGRMIIVVHYVNNAKVLSTHGMYMYSIWIIQPDNHP